MAVIDAGQCDLERLACRLLQHQLRLQLPVMRVVLANEYRALLCRTACLLLEQLRCIKQLGCLTFSTHKAFRLGIELFLGGGRAAQHKFNEVIDKHTMQFTQRAHERRDAGQDLGRLLWTLCSSFDRS